MDNLEKYTKAKDLGYSDEEIFNFLAQQNPEFSQKVKESKEAGYSNEDILDYFGNSGLSEKDNPQQSKNGNPFETGNISKQQYEKMSTAEKIQYAKDLEKEQRYNFSKSFTKNLASGATFGATENIDALRPEEGEDPVGAFGGQAFGASVPIGLIGKGIGLGLRGATAAVQHGPKILQYLNRFAHGFGTGATYESGKQGVNAFSGKDVELSQIPVTGALFGAGESLIQAAGDVGRRFLRLSPKHQAQVLEEGLIPNDLPKSQYETAEEMLKFLQQQKQKNKIPNPDLSEEIGNLFSPNRFYNTTEGGKAFRKEIMDIDQNVYRGVNELYKKSRELNSNIEEIHPVLVNNLESKIEQLSSIPEPSDVQKRLLRASKNILKNIVEYQPITDEAGNVIGKEISGFKPINNQTLIEQVQSLRQIIDYDFSHGNTKNIFKPLIKDLEDAALNAAEHSGTPQAADALKEAKKSYRMWSEAFDNDYVRPFRDSSNQDYSKLYKSSLDFDEHNMLKRILNTTENGQELINASTRDIVEKNLGKYFDNPKQFSSKDFDKAVRELEAVISPEQAQEVRNLFREHSKRQLSNEEVIAAKYLDKRPEDIQKMMNSRSGIKELRKDFSSSEQKRKLFDTLSKQKMRSGMRQGNIEHDAKGDELYKFFNNEHNFEIFSELIGESETEAARQLAKQIGKEQIKAELRSKRISNIAKNAAGYKALQLIFGVF